MPRRKPPVIADALLDQLLDGADARTAFDTDGLIAQLKKALVERAHPACRPEGAPLRHLAWPLRSGPP